MGWFSRAAEPKRAKVWFSYNLAKSSGTSFAVYNKLEPGKYIGSMFKEEGMPTYGFLAAEGSYLNYIIIKENGTAEFSLYYDSRHSIESGRYEFVRSEDNRDVYRFTSSSRTFEFRFMHLGSIDAEFYV